MPALALQETFMIPWAPPSMSVTVAPPKASEIRSRTSGRPAPGSPALVVSSSGPWGRPRRRLRQVVAGTTVESPFVPGETRHETYGLNEFKVHDLENLGDREMVFMTVEYKDSANKPMQLPEGVRPQAAAA